MTEQMTSRPMTAAERGALGGRKAAQTTSLEQRRERGRAGALAGAVTVIERSWDEMPEELKTRILARVGA